METSLTEWVEEYKQEEFGQTVTTLTLHMLHLVDTNNLESDEKLTK
jgi:hypothetical protein